jgi:peroxiredoxin
MNHSDPRRFRFIAWAVTSECFRPAPVLNTTTRSADFRKPVAVRCLYAAVAAAPSGESVPTLVNLYKKFSDRPFQIVGVSSDTEENKCKAFIAANKMTWPEYIDLPGSLQALFEIHEFPTYIVLDRNGVIQMRQSGWDTEIGS